MGDGVAGRMARLADVPGDAIVVAAGLGSGDLVGDDTGVPVQGQVVRLTDPGLPGWLLDEDNPAGLTYVVPRGDDVVCGGTAVERAAVLSRAVGLRPGRPTVRLDCTVVDGLVPRAG